MPKQVVASVMIRLLPPRPSFALDMTPDEAEIMIRHAQYWTALLDQGKAMMFGPVMDPKGAWGVGVLSVADLDEASALADRDPVIEAGIGFRTEVLLMPQTHVGFAGLFVSKDPPTNL